MKVVIDISPLHTGHKTRGIGVYTKELVRALKSLDRKNQYILTTRPQEVKHISLIHYPYFDLFFRTLPLKHKFPVVVTIHDVIPLIFPRDFRPGIKGKLRFLWQRLSLRQVSAVITDSANSKTDIIKYLKVKPSQITVIPLASAPHFLTPVSSRQLQKIKHKYHLPDKFLLYVGDINPHKNLHRLIEAFSKIIPASPDVYLILVSRSLAQPIPEAAKIKHLIQSLNLTAKIKLLTTVPLDPPTDLHSLYQLAQSYVHPSLYEGFGLPVLEALTVGTPVVCSHAASLPEVYGAAAITIDPRDTESLTAGINQSLQLTPKQRQALIHQGKNQSAQFSWRQTAQRTLQVYHQISHDQK